MKKVSVLLAAYKEPIQWLERSIDSLIAQTYSNVEIIVVVDNPEIDRRVVELLEQYSNSKGLKYIINDKNIGLARSLNIAYEKSSGDYIARLDADDYCDNERIERQVSFLDHNKDISLVGTGIWQIDCDSNIIKKSAISHDFNVLKEKIYYSTIAYHPTWMVRRGVFEKLAGYRHYPAAQDTDFLLRMMESGFFISNITEPLVYYRVNNNSISVNKSLLQRKCQFLILKHHNYRVKKNEDIYDERYVDEIVSSLGAVNLSLIHI